MIKNKNITFVCAPQETVADDRLLEGFSLNDICATTYLACIQIIKPKYKIVVQEFSDKYNRIVFKLKANNTESVIVKTANQIVMDKDLINNLSKEDAVSVSYTAGYESSQNKNE